MYNKGSTNIEQIPEFAISHILTAEAVYSACEFYGIIHPKIVVAQSILETGYYKSNICIKYNNIFGLYDSYQKDYFKFNYWWESVEAYRNKVQCKLGKNYCSEEEYYKFLEELPYATDPNYVSKLQKIISKCQTQNSKINTLMRRFVHYIRQVFCKHVFEQKQSVEYLDEKGFVVTETDNYICKKCLYVKRVK